MEVCLGQNKSIQKHIINIEGKPINQYVSSNEETLTNYTYANCVSINMIETVNCAEETTRIPNEDGSICDPYNIIIHVTQDEDNNVQYNSDCTPFKFPNDGWYRFTHIVIPTKKYFVDLGFDGEVNLDQLKDTLIERFGDCEMPERIVVFDTEKYCFLLGEFFKYQILVTDENNNESYSFETHYDWKQITFDEVLCIIKSEFSSTIQCYSRDIVNYSYLEEAYLNKVNDLLKVYQNEVCSQNCNDFTKSNQADIQLRDYYWMALNAVKYANELGNYCKALTLLNCVSQCSNKDNQDNYCFQLNYGKGCGCS